MRDGLKNSIDCMYQFVHPFQREKFSNMRDIHIFDGSYFTKLEWRKA